MNISMIRWTPVVAAIAALGCIGTAQAGRADRPQFGAVYNASVSKEATPLISGFVGNDFVLDVAGIPSWGPLDDPNNRYRVATFAPGTLIDQISWDVTITAYDPSWLLDITIQIVNSDGNGVYFSPSGDVGPGTFSSGQQSISLVDLGLQFNVGNNGKLYFQFYEGYDDHLQPDGLWNSGNVTFLNAVPEPAAYAMMIVGLLGVGAIARRRR